MRLAATTLGFLALGCGSDPGARVEIAETRTTTRAYAPVVPGATSAQRFGADERPAADSSDGLADLLQYALPSGWQELRPTSDRLINLQPAGDPSASCYLTFLAGGGGGLESNVNRWLGQFGGEPLDAEAIAALPKHLLLGREATLVEVEGTFLAMGGPPQSGFALLGLVLSDPSGGIFLKFTGPTALVAAERANFLALADSLGMKEEHAGAAGDGHEHAGVATPGSSGGLAFVTPAEWRQTEPRPMREVNFSLGNGAAECYVTRLGGDGGGLVPNLNRWRNQFGEAPLTAEQLEALERVTMLGQPIPVLEVGGDFTGMDGGTKSDQGMLGVAWIGEGESLFVKLVGPRDVVHAERANFIAFVASLEEAR